MLTYLKEDVINTSISNGITVKSLSSIQIANLVVTINDSVNPVRISPGISGLMC